MVPSVQPVPPSAAPLRKPSPRQDAAWELSFARLLEFKRQHGHFAVPPDADHKLLHFWSDHQRTRLKAGRLLPERLARLQAVGFPGDIEAFSRQAANRIWDRHFAGLMEFHQQHGHFKVSKKDANYKSLAEWANHQRRQYYSGKLKPDRRQRLEAAGFPWCLNMRRGPVGKVPDGVVPDGGAAAIDFPAGNGLPPASAWDEKYDDLVQFYQRFGHCYVPHPWPEQPALGLWVQTQRRNRLTLAPGQTARLDAIHFIWTDGWENLGADWREQQKRVMGHFYHVPDQPAEHFSINRNPVIHFDEDTEEG